ncbi:copper resistance CopC family protein [Actinoplanes sp. NPDC049802]|uniref:copper resistance CopC family protein n=1 Tax=Actinoplanes sp. NPDC049802 TaxID=3154742 RepID=UPI0033C7793A
MSGPVARRLTAVLIVLPALLWLATVAGRDRAAPQPMTLVASEPFAGAVLRTAPTVVALTWSAPADPSLSHVAVVDGAGRTVPTGAPGAGPGTVLRVPIEGDLDGVYTLGYHVVGVDGGKATGSLRFAVGAGPVPAGPGPAVDVEGAHEHGVDPVSAVLLLIDFGAVLAVAVLLLRRPGPRRRT